MIVASQKGDEVAFAELLKKYLKPLYNFSYQMVRDTNVAEDITQEAFIKIWKNLRHFDTTKNFKNWAYLITRRTAIDYLKKKKTLPFSFFEDEEGNNILDDKADEKMLVEDILYHQETANRLDDFLAKLPENYRTLLVLRYKEDWDLKEVAEIMDLPYNTVKSQHRRALRKLRDLMGKVAPPEVI